ncbi:MAG: hypothetical protein ACJ0IB_05060 [Verrucomicrobiales bacterium]
MPPQSTQLFFRIAEITPSGTPIQIAMPRALSPKMSELGKDCAIISLTGLPLLVDTAKEPFVIMLIG